MSERSLAEILLKNSSPHSAAGTIQRKCDKCKKKSSPSSGVLPGGQSLHMCRISFMMY